MPIEIKVVRTAAGIRNAYTRMPFRFGVITMKASPMLTLAVEIEAGGGRATGYAADFLAFRWFDKRPEKSLADNCADLLRTVEVASQLYLEAGRDGFATPFDLWRATHGEIERTALAEGFNRLGAAFGSSMLERAVIDAAGRLSGRTFFGLVHDDLLGIELGALSEELRGRRMRAFLPARPLERVAVRHTVGLLDPITAADLSDPVADGLPETLEDYLDRDGIRYLKIKVAGALEQDIARLERVAAVLDRRERRFHVSLDGNEQYQAPEDFLGLIEAIKAAPKLWRIYDQIMFIEQPLDRAVALDPGALPMLRALDKPVIIDEADGFVSAFREAVRLGYRGTSHKNCKGVYKSLHNLARAAVHNARRGRPELFLSAEDLSTLPVVPLQADLATVALLGIAHVERNGHHYFRGLGHLPEAEKAAALAAHPDLYQRQGGEVFLKIAGGMLDCASLQVPGMGFAALPDLAAMTPVDEWDFASLGQEEQPPRGTDPASTGLR
jgi:hypothetical protein